MIVHDVEQGSPEWMQARLGMPTTSQFHRILTPQKLTYAAGAVDYRNQLLAERIIGQPIDEETWSRWMLRGSQLEAEAVAYYELQRDTGVQRVGYVTNDAGTVGCSPDGLVGDDGGLEVKCYGAKHHVSVLLGEDPAKRTQVQGSIWICERDWWDQLAYLPRFPQTLIRTPRDETFIKALASAMEQFLVELARGQKVIDALGPKGRTDSLARLLVKSV